MSRSIWTLTLALAAPACAQGSPRADAPVPSDECRVEAVNKTGGVITVAAGKARLEPKGTIPLGGTLVFGADCADERIVVSATRSGVSSGPGVAGIFERGENSDYQSQSEVVQVGLVPGTVVRVEFERMAVRR